jgi:STE24 endopeptidase
MFAASLVAAGATGLSENPRPGSYTGLGVEPMMGASNDAMALILFALVLPVFSFLLSPLTSLGSRKHEFEADAFAATAHEFAGSGVRTGKTV